MQRGGPDVTRGVEHTTMQHNVVDHVVLVLGLVEAEGAAEVFLMGGLGLAGGVSHLYVHFQGSPNSAGSHKHACQ